MNLRQLVNSKKFDATASTVIVANAVVLGAGTFPSLADNRTLDTLNNVFYTFFIIELGLRIASYGRTPQQFFRSGWNVFDFVAITATLIPGVAASAQALRLIRLARIVRLIRFLPDARILMTSVAKSLPPLGSLFALTFLLIFIYGMLGWSLFGQQLPDQWGTVGTSMLTLFILLTLENFPTYLEEASAVSPYAAVFFVSYVLLAAFVVFNLLIGIIINSLEQAREIEEQRTAPPAAAATDALVRLREALDALDAELNQPAAKHQQCAILNKSAIRQQAESPNR